MLRVVEVARSNADHDIRLMPYVAHKAPDHSMEHHHPQFVTVHDLGDMGYTPGTNAMEECPMVAITCWCNWTTMPIASTCSMCLSTLIHYFKEIALRRANAN